MVALIRSVAEDEHRRRMDFDVAYVDFDGVSFSE